jgi:hypothetical protein
MFYFLSQIYLWYFIILWLLLSRILNLFFSQFDIIIFIFGGIGVWTQLHTC